jgi:hypothetical protein
MKSLRLFLLLCVGMLLCLPLQANNQTFSDDYEYEMTDDLRENLKDIVGQNLYTRYRETIINEIEKSEYNKPSDYIYLNITKKTIVSKAINALSFEELDDIREGLKLRLDNYTDKQDAIQHMKTLRTLGLTASGIFAAGSIGCLCLFKNFLKLKPPVGASALPFKKSTAAVSILGNTILLSILALPGSFIAYGCHNWLNNIPQETGPQGIHEYKAKLLKAVEERMLQLNPHAFDDEEDDDDDDDLDSKPESN